MEVVVVQEIQHQHLTIRRGLQGWLDTELLDLVQVELPLLAQESAMQGVRVLGTQFAPRRAKRPAPAGWTSARLST